MSGPLPSKVTEVAVLNIRAGEEERFEAGLAEAVPLFERAKGCLSMRVERSIEQPLRYRLFVEWQTLENHTVEFRNSADFQQWRSLVGSYFATPPEVEHIYVAVPGFAAIQERE